MLHSNIQLVKGLLLGNEQQIPYNTYEMLAVENIGEFGESILIRQSFAYQSFYLPYFSLCDKKK